MGRQDGIKDCSSLAGGRIMRLLFLTFYYPPDLCAGSFRSGALIKSLQKKMGPGDSIDIITTVPNRYHDFCPDAGDEKIADNIHIYRVKLPAHSSGMKDQAVSYIWYALFVLKTIAFRKYDRVFATSSRLFTAFLGSMVSRFKRCPLYLDLRDIFVENMEEMFAGKKVSLFLPVLRWIEKVTLSRASYLNCVSPGFEPYYRKLFRGRIRFHTNGIDQEFLERDWSAPSDFDNMIITYAGNIGEGQGLHNLFPQLSRAYPEITFQIIGNGGKKQSVAERVKDEPNVILIPPVTRDELMDYYEKSDGLLMHLNALKAFERVLPSKVFEYGATGKLMLAGVAGYARKFVEENLPDAVCFDPCNVEQLRKRFPGEKVERKDRTDFCARYARTVIMDRLADDLLQDSRS
jgi:glycosyltransferase involved in cell wall biosynthesis